MKSTGIIRRIDELGRIVIPVELRNKLELTEKDYIEIFVEGHNIILKKAEQNCIFCGSSKKLSEYNGKQICKTCLTNLSELNKIE